MLNINKGIAYRNIRVNANKSYSQKEIQKVKFDSSSARSFKANRSRTRLLLLLNSECTKLIKNHQSMINHKTFGEVAREFNQDNFIIHLKPEIYSPPTQPFGKGEGKLYKPKRKTESLGKPIDCFSKNENENYPKFHARRRREVLGRRKLEYFRKTIIKKMINNSNLIPIEDQSQMKSESSSLLQEKVDYINIDQGIQQKHTQIRVEKGFNYLQALSKSLKFRRSNNNCIYSAERE